MIILHSVDWLEVYLIEKNANAAGMLQSKGYLLEKMPYTTRVFAEVYYVYYANKRPVGVLCREPLSVKDNGAGGILDAGAITFKFDNSVLYHRDCANIIRHTLIDTGAVYKHISRIDICADFQIFNNGMLPLTLLKGYAAGKYSKVGQSNFCLHGKDNDGLRFNSIRFGNPTSDISTRFYNKSLEMVDQKWKTYIAECWSAIGMDLTRYVVKGNSKHFITNATPENVENPIKGGEVVFVKPVWRVEFSIHHNGRHYRCNDEVKEITLRDIETRQGIANLFHSLAMKYFDFRDMETSSRKYRAKRINLFPQYQDVETWQKIPKTMPNTANKTDHFVINSLEKMVQDTRNEEDIRTQVNTLLETIERNVAQQPSLISMKKILSYIVNASKDKYSYTEEEQRAIILTARTFMWKKGLVKWAAWKNATNFEVEVKNTTIMNTLYNNSNNNEYDNK